MRALFVPAMVCALWLFVLIVLVYQYTDTNPF